MKKQVSLFDPHLLIQPRLVAADLLPLYKSHGGHAAME